MATKTKLFVSKLPPTCTDFELEKLFGRFGEVTECSIKGSYAFIHMETEDQAQEAISNLHTWEMGPHKISVQQSTSKKAVGGGGCDSGGSRKVIDMGFKDRVQFLPMARGGVGGIDGGIVGGGIVRRPGPHTHLSMPAHFLGHTGLQPPIIKDRYADYTRRPLLPGISNRRPPPSMPREPLPFRESYNPLSNPYSNQMALVPSHYRRSPQPIDRRMPMDYDRRDPYDGLHPGPRILPKIHFYPLEYKMDVLSNSLNRLSIRPERADKLISGQGSKLNLYQRNNKTSSFPGSDEKFFGNFKAQKLISGLGPKLIFYEGKKKTSGFDVNNKKYFGYFKCWQCNKCWASAHSWVKCYQQCNHCFSKVYPWKQTELEPSGGKKSVKPHPMNLCQKCKQLGAQCWTHQRYYY